VIIAISVVCSVVAVITVLSIIGVNLGETSITAKSIVETPEELIMASGEKICCEKYVIIHQVLLETVFMGEDTAFRYIIKNYRDDPAYNEECSRLWVQMKKWPIDPNIEPLSTDELLELRSVFGLACHHSIITEP